jgi:hypothetical protein
MIRPFLLRFAKPCVSPGRRTTNAAYAYDPLTDMVLNLGLPGHPPAIFAQGSTPPRTKKGDVEKGEDTKDRRMWQ